MTASFPARRPGTCSTCGLPFAAGDSIRYTRRHLLVHRTCPPGAFDAALLDEAVELAETLTVPAIVTEITGSPAAFAVDDSDIFDLAALDRIIERAKGTPAAAIKPWIDPETGERFYVIGEGGFLRTPPEGWGAWERFTRTILGVEVSFLRPRSAAADAAAETPPPPPPAAPEG